MVSCHDVFVSTPTVPLCVQLFEFIFVLVKLIFYAVNIYSKINVKQIHTAERKSIMSCLNINVCFYIVDKCSESLGSMPFHLTVTVDFVLNVHVISGFDISRSVVLKVISLCN